MKKAMLVIAATLLLMGCSAQDVEGKGKQQSDMQTAIEFVSDVKVRMSKEVNEEYFESDEWKAFVDGFWKGYNEGQSKMKDPEYMDLEKVTY